MTNLIGQSLGRYHILEQLGEGGMAARSSTPSASWAFAASTPLPSACPLSPPRHTFTVMVRTVQVRPPRNGAPTSRRSNGGGGSDGFLTGRPRDTNATPMDLPAARPRAPGE